MGSESCFSFIALGNADKMVGTPQVNLHIIIGLFWSIQ